MFTAEYRDQVRQRVLELARADSRVTAGALTGSMATGLGDEWSDIDADEHDFVLDLVGKSLETWHLGPTGRAQAGPEVQDDWLTDLQDLRESDRLPTEQALALVGADREIRDTC